MHVCMCVRMYACMYNHRHSQRRNVAGVVVGLALRAHSPDFVRCHTLVLRSSDLLQNCPLAFSPVYYFVLLAIPSIWRELAGRASHARVSVVHWAACSKYLPAAHSTQSDTWSWPVPCAKVPATQSTHVAIDVAPGTVENVAKPRSWQTPGGGVSRQIKEKTGSKTTRKKALEREKVKTDSNHVPTSVDAYTVVALKERFEDKDIATGLLLSLNKHRLTILCILGSNLTDHKKLGFRDEDALTKAHKSIDLKYLRHLN